MATLSILGAPPVLARETKMVRRMNRAAMSTEIVDGKVVDAIAAVAGISVDKYCR